MDYTIFIKKDFLNQPVDSFAQDFNMVDYKGFKKIVSHNTVFGMGKLATFVCRKYVKSVFESVDGIPLTSNNVTTIRKDGFVDRDEMYQLIKNSYKNIYGTEISQDELSKMTVREAIDLVIDSYNK